MLTNNKSLIIVGLGSLKCQVFGIKDLTFLSDQLIFILKSAKEVSMKIAYKIKIKIDKIPPGKVFNYQDLGILNQEYSAAAKTISRMVKQKNIKRISTGVFCGSRRISGERGLSTNSD